MEQKELLQIVNSLIDQLNDYHSVTGTYAQACEILRIHAGKKSAFLDQLKQYNPSKLASDYAAEQIKHILVSFLVHVESGLQQGISIERQAQIDVVSDILDQANSLLENKKSHPAAPAMIIGAVLEEFLRTWIEIEALSLGGLKPCLDTYSKVLKTAELITKQDVKDIVSWAGIRNHAAHGEWEEVKDRNRIRLMLEGVNLFMRKYSSN